MIVTIGENKIKCKHVVIVYEQVNIWDAFIPDKPFDFEVFDYNFCQHSDGTESVCVSVQAEIMDIREG